MEKHFIYLRKKKTGEIRKYSFAILKNQSIFEHMGVFVEFLQNSCKMSDIEVKREYGDK